MLLLIFSRQLLFFSRQILDFLINCRLGYNKYSPSRIAFSSFSVFTHAQLNNVSQLVDPSNMITITAEQCRTVNNICLTREVYVNYTEP